jgi:mannan endo-1,4-beta-mannosidase
MNSYSTFMNIKLFLFIAAFAIIGIDILLFTRAAPPNVLPGDINGDNTVNIVDLSTLLSNYNRSSTQASNPNADINNDTKINVFDLSILLSNYGKSGPSASFVTRQGADLMLDGKRFRASGANMYWTIWHDDGTVPQKFEIEDAMATVAEMGGQSVRIFAGSFGCSQCYETGLNTFNEANLDRLDYAISEAKKDNVRLMLTMVDEWDYEPHWSTKANFTNWRGFTSGYSDGAGEGPYFATSENKFFTDANIRSDFKNYINHMANHLNPYTNLKYKEDPTIYAWETGNEVWNAETVQPISDWTKDIAQYIKSVAPNQLAVDGSANNKKVDTNALASPYVDIADVHFYGSADLAQMQSDATTATNANKGFMVGEYKSIWDNSTELVPWLTAFENTGSNAPDIDMYWFIRPHKDPNGFYTNRGAYPTYYPGPLSNANMRANTLSLRNHGFKMRGTSPAPADKKPGPPLMAAPTWTGTAMRVNWRGVVAADTYNIERSNDNGTTWQVVKTGITDWDSPWIDPSGSTTTSKYRIQGVNRSGVKGCYSTQPTCN